MNLKKLSFPLSGCLVSLLFGVAVYAFWLFVHPEYLSFHEQYQLFLTTPDYFLGDISVAGGLADYLSEFLVQFFYYPAAGATIMAVLFVIVRRLVWRMMNQRCYLLSFIPSLLLIWAMGDESVLLSYTAALIIVLCCALLTGKRWIWADILIVPLLYWAAGPMAWLYVALRIFSIGKKALLLLVYMPLAQFAMYHFFMQQWPLSMVMIEGLNYYRVPLHPDILLLIIPLAILFLIIVTSWEKVRSLSPSVSVPVSLVLLVIPLAGIFLLAFDADRTELLKQDYLIRSERWDELISRAEKKTVKTAFWSNSVNLALSQRGQLADRMFEFYQSGGDALVMPMVRDCISDLPSAEAFYRLGMVNSALRYFFDVQESVLNFKKSGRCEQRIAECLIINGKYDIARKHLDLLSQTLFYRSWAEKAIGCLGDETKIGNHRQWGRIRQYRYKNDFLFNYNEKDKMFGQLFLTNKENKMALQYFLGELLLKGDAEGFVQYLPLARLYGGYVTMPRGYQDAMRCIQSRGDIQDSPYAEYARRMTAQTMKGGGDVQVH